MTKPSEKSVFVRISKQDSLICEAVFDRTASRKTLKEDFAAALMELDPPPPYRTVDPAIFEAIHLKTENSLTYKEASVQIFGTAAKADSIRGWDNWLRQCQDTTSPLPR